MAPDRTKKKVRVVNKNKTIKKQKATEGQSSARKKIQDARSRMEEKKTRKAELEERAAKARSAKAKADLKDELEKVENEIMEVSTEIRGAEEDIEKFRKEEDEAEKEEDFEEMEVDDPDDPRASTEQADSTESSGSDLELLTALLNKTRIETPGTAISRSLGARLRESQAVVAYKPCGPLGRAAIVGDVEIKNCPIFRIRKDVTIDESKVPNIVEDRRAGKINPNTKKPWGVGDIQDIVGIAIAVPEGYTKKVEELTVPFKWTLRQKLEFQEENKPIPRMTDVQLCIQWWEPLENGAIQSWESRAGCRSIWKKAGDSTIFDNAERFESAYRDRGGRHSSEEPRVAPYAIPPVGTSLSPESTPGPEQEPSTATRENTPETQPTGSKKTAADKKAAREKFKIDWCELKNIEPGDMTNIDDGNMMAAFNQYWKIESAA